MKFLAVATLGRPLNPPSLGDFEQEILSESPPDLGGWGAEALNTEAKKLYRIHVKLTLTKSLNAIAVTLHRPLI
ncbi:hypothetical protein ACKFKH_10640 [Phormidesmis sp. 146-20]